jgi:flagellar basal body rod protein FlgB
MALTSALFTGLSGLNVNQTRLNVVGNNIANANTTAFKSSRALFKPQFYVTEGGGTTRNSSKRPRICSKPPRQRSWASSSHCSSDASSPTMCCPIRSGTPMSGAAPTS